MTPKKQCNEHDHIGDPISYHDQPSVWCDLERGHQGPHRAYSYDLQALILWPISYRKAIEEVHPT